jgi:hypothetical protein
MESITVRVVKTVQVKQYEPVVVEVAHTVDVEPGEDVADKRFEVYKDVTRAVKKFIENEIRKYNQDEA